MAETGTRSAQPPQSPQAPQIEVHELPADMPPTTESPAPAPARALSPSPTPAPINPTATPDIAPAPYPPPPYQAEAEKQATAATAAIQAIPLNHLREEPAVVDCPRCGKRGLTRTDKSPNGQTHCAALVICCFLSCLLAWLPYAIRSCNDTEHMCGSCGCPLAIYKSDGVAHVVPHTRPPVPTHKAPSGSEPAPVAAPAPAVTK